MSEKKKKNWHTKEKSGGKKTTPPLIKKTNNNKRGSKFRGKSEVLDVDQYMQSINVGLCWLYFMKNEITICIFTV